MTDWEIVCHFIKEGAKQKCRWVSVLPKDLPEERFKELLARKILQTKETDGAKVFRFNARKLKPIKGVRPEVSKEIQKAILKGEAWTAFRPFLDGSERWGAMRCGTRPRSRKCLKYSTHVSYCTGFPDGIQGRVAMCANCLGGRATLS